MKNWIYRQRVGILIGGSLLLFWFGYEMGATNGNQRQEAHIHAEQQEASSWTCSMHPQIDLPEFGPCPICGMDLISKEETESDDIFQLKMSETAIRIANIQTSKVVQVKAGKSVQMQGEIVLDETKKSVQTAHFEGRLEKLAVRYEGETVREGQIIGEVYSPELMSAQQEFLQAHKMKAAQPALFVAARQKLIGWKLSDEQIEQIIKTGEAQAYFPLTADVSGTVTALKAQVGDHIPTGHPIFSVANLNYLWVKLEAYEKDLPWISIGDKIAVKVMAYPEELFQATVDFISPVIDPKTRVVEVRARLSNWQGKLKPAMFVTANLKVSKVGEEATLTIPRSAVLWTGKQSIVYVKLPQTIPVFEFREISLGSLVNDAYEVLSGLTIGEEVVSNGAFTIDAAAQLSNKKSMMHRMTEGALPLNNEASLAVQELAFSMNPQSQVALKTLLSHYLTMKDALIQSDSVGVESAATAWQTMQGELSVAFADEGTAIFWQEQMQSINKALIGISTTQLLSVQREDFLALSSTVIRLIQAFSADEGLFLQYCPMVLNDKGGFWISKEKEILNPYFGERMLRCGEVRNW